MVFYSTYTKINEIKNVSRIGNKEVITLDKTIMQHVHKSMFQAEAVNVIKNNVLSCCIISNGIWSPWAFFLINFDQFVNKTTTTSLAVQNVSFLWFENEKN